jgi:type IX secretion system PorP/SprF family membrane protein
MKKYIVTALVCLLAWPLKSQDAVFGQFGKGAIYFNPAFAGTAKTKDHDPAIRVGTQYRNQWGRDVTFNTGLLYYDQSVGNNYSNLGFYALQDNAGDGGFTTSQINAVYAYQTPINRGNWAAQYGLSFGYRNQGVDMANLRFEDQIDYTQGTVRSSAEVLTANRKGNADVAAGFVLYNKYFQVGLAAHNITNPVYDYTGAIDNRVPRRYTLHSGGLIELRNIDKNQYSAIQVQGMMMVQGNFSQLHANVSLVNNEFSVGVGHRKMWYYAKNADALTFNIAIAVKNVYINYSYEHTLSALKMWTPRTHELGIALKLNKSRYSAPWRPTCPLY